MGDSTGMPGLLLSAIPTAAATATVLWTAAHARTARTRTAHRGTGPSLPRPARRPRRDRTEPPDPAPKPPAPDLSPPNSAPQDSPPPGTRQQGSPPPDSPPPHSAPQDSPPPGTPQQGGPPPVVPRPSGPPPAARAAHGPVPPRLGRATALCALLSLATSAAQPFLEVTTGWKLPEAGLLLLLIVLTTRYAPLRQLYTALPLAALAVCAWPLPLVAGSFLEHTGVAAFWLLPALAAAASGAYPRRQEHRRRQAVTTARRDQRLQLSRDLHDFVAHDISGIVVQAQAARFVASADPHQAVLALERIERAGLNALASMDRTITMLHGDDASTTDALPGLPQLPTLVAEFSAAGGTRARLDLPPDAEQALSREAGAAAYRIVVEALTNVRRHAPRATRADIVLTPTPTAVELTVTNDRSGRARPGSRARGGHGLPALTEHALALGGTLSAGPYDTTGWRLTAVLPRKEAPAP
ncbi:sensor histidine kinase [Streptomyces sp. NPDC004111]|uniref:sensor histidine kinase n=1 Tax=Streptomyces sp. NPDC004111 TaxID=3364690 RepID=UPI0036B47D4D